MKILLVAATTFEIDEAVQKNPLIDVLITGVGVPATIYKLMEKLNNNSYDIVVQAGVAGCFTNTINLGEVALINKDSFGDIGIEEKGSFKTIFDMGFGDKNSPPFEDGWLINKNSYLAETQLKILSSVTVNKVSDATLQKQQLQDTFNADLETMEGAALHYVCLQKQVDFLQLRSISNYVGERDKTKWKMKDAITNLNNKLNKLIEQLSK